jgi:hypothetical protein
MSNQSLVLHDIEKGRRREAEGKTYCLFGMVCAAISTDVWDWAVVEESSGLDEPTIPARSRRGLSTHLKAVDEDSNPQYADSDRPCLMQPPNILILLNVLKDAIRDRLCHLVLVCGGAESG